VTEGCTDRLVMSVSHRVATPGVCRPADVAAACGSVGPSGSTSTGCCATRHLW
jgi:hypothetical protein